jgi:hypothetical protein
MHAKDPKDCLLQGDIPESAVILEIENNLKLKKSGCVIPLIAVCKEANIVKDGPIKITKFTYSMVFDFGITLQ